MHYLVATIITDPDTGELAEQFTRNLLRLPRESILNTWTPEPEVEGRGHLPLCTATAECCEVLRRFVRTGEIGAGRAQFT